VRGVAPLAIFPPPPAGEAAIAPGALSVNVDDYAPTGLSEADIVYQDVGAACTISGITTGADGRKLTLYNTSSSPSHTLTLTHDDPASAAANRMRLPNGAALPIPALGAVTLQYHGPKQRWLIRSASFPTAIDTVIALASDVPLADSGYQMVRGVATSGWFIIAAFRYTEAHYGVGTHGSVGRVLRGVCQHSVTGLTSHLRLVRASDLSVVSGSSLTFGAAFTAPATVESSSLSLVDGATYYVQADAIGSADPGAFASIQAALVARQVL